MAIDRSRQRQLDRLRIWNIAVGLILAAQAIMIAVLTNSFSLPVTATFMSGPPGTAPELHHLFDIATGWGVTVFLAISAIAGVTRYGAATPGRRHGVDHLSRLFPELGAAA